MHGSRAALELHEAGASEPLSPADLVELVGKSVGSSDGSSDGGVDCIVLSMCHSEPFALALHAARAARFVIYWGSVEVNSAASAKFAKEFYENLRYDHRTKHHDYRRAFKYAEMRMKQVSAKSIRRGSGQ